MSKVSYALLDMLPDPAVLLAGDGTIMAANRAFAALLGTVPDQLKERPLAKWIEMAESDFRLLTDSCCRTSGTMPFAIHLRNEKGDVSRYHMHGLLVDRDEIRSSVTLCFRVASGTRAVLGFQRLNEEITRLKQEVLAREKAETTMRESQERLIGIISSALDAIITVDHEQRIVDFNGAAERMFGCSASDAIGCSIDRFIPQLFRAMHATHITEFGKTQVTKRQGSLSTVYGQRASGEEFPLETSISQFATQMGKFHTVILRDITEREKAEHAATHLAAIVTSADSAIVSKDLRGLVTTWNKGAERLFGYTSEEMVGQPVTRLFPPDRLGEEDRILQSVRQGLSIDLHETVRCRKDGSEVYLSLTISPLIDAHGNVIGASTIANDITDRKRAETALRESELRFRALIERIGDVFWISDPTAKKLVYVSQAFAVLWGREPRELHEHFELWLDAIHEADRARVAASFFKNIYAGTYDEEYRVIRPDGSMRWVRDRGKPLGVGSLVAGIAEDITERKWSEDALAEQKRLYQTVTDNASVGLLIMDERQHCVFTNPAAEQLTGYRFTDVQGRTLHEVVLHIYPDGRPYPLAECPIDRAFPEENRMQGEEIFVHKDGHFYPVAFTASPIRNHAGKAIGTIIEVQDISLRKEAEAALYASQERYQLLANSAELLLRSESPQAVVDLLCRKVMASLDCQIFLNYLLDPSSKRLHLNASAGILEEESRRIEWLEMGSAVCGSVVRDGEEIIVERVGEVEDARTELLRSYGVQAYACHPLVAQDRLIGTLSFGTRTRTAFSSEDLSLMKTITDQVAIAMQRKQNEDALREAKMRVQFWNEELEQAVHNKTAELKQSQERLRALTSELNLSEQRERKRLATELHDHLQQMLVFGKLTIGQGKRVVAGVPACKTVLNKVDDILSEALTYSRTLVAELSPPVLRDHGLAASLTWLAEYMKNKYEQTVTATVPDDQSLKLPEDQVILLFQSARELLINSAKHAGTGQATLTLDQHADQLCITVKDEGKGFDLAAAETPNSGISSTFGLYSIQERIRALGGSFTMESEVGQGTTATLVVPLIQNVEERVLSREVWGTDASPAAGHMQHLDNLKGQRIIPVLLVDDHAMVRQGLRSVLDAYADVQVIAEARDGVEAVKLVETLRPRVVVMDINMPNMTGIEATEHIKFRYPDTIVIGISVNVGDDNSVAMQRAGAATLVTKEAAVEQLYDTIQETVKKRPKG